MKRLALAFSAAALLLATGLPAVAAGVERQQKLEVTFYYLPG
jgi:hypothetical protein